jgi:hypothetical protein
MRTQIAAIAALIGLSLAATIPAQAQTARHSRQRQYSEPSARVVPAQVCRKMCPEDLSPCDPTYFKVADGRCAGIHPSR